MAWDTSTKWYWQGFAFTTGIDTGRASPKSYRPLSGVKKIAGNSANSEQVGEVFKKIPLEEPDLLISVLEGLMRPIRIEM